MERYWIILKFYVIRLVSYLKTLAKQRVAIVLCLCVWLINAYKKKPGVIFMCYKSYCFNALAENITNRNFYNRSIMGWQSKVGISIIMKIDWHCII